MQHHNGIVVYDDTLAMMLNASWCALSCNEAIYCGCAYEIEML